MVLFHLNADTHLHALTRNAWVAVDFFFVLSGFVLMSGFGGRVPDSAAYRRFAVRRLARLYPLHLATLALLFVMKAWSAARSGGPLFAGTHGLPALLQNLALVHGFTTDALSWNFPSWSISLELWASLGLGLTLWRAGERARWVFAIAAGVLACLVVVLGEPAGPARDEAGALLKAAHYLTAFCAGAALFPVFEAASRRGLEPPGWGEPLALVLVAAIFLFADRMVSPVSVGLFALVIMIFAAERGPVSGWLQRVGPQALGRWSYSIYLVHPFWTVATYGWIVSMGERLGRRALSPDGRLVLGGSFAMDGAALACLAAVVTTAALTFRLIERPGLKLARTKRDGPATLQRTPTARAT